ncbi:MAG: hypothetical protein AAGG72_03635, partial [Pseudomonadota bacterium]
LRQHARRTVVYANEYTVAPYRAISDGEIREADLMGLLLEGVAPEQIANNSQPAMKGLPSPELLAGARSEILKEVVSTVQLAQQPVPLEALADKAVRVLGHDKTVGLAWGGAGSFRDLLANGLPEHVRLSDAAPYFVFDTKRQAEPSPLRAEVRPVERALPTVESVVQAQQIERGIDPGHVRPGLDEQNLDVASQGQFAGERTGQVAEMRGGEQQQPAVASGDTAGAGAPGGYGQQSAAAAVALANAPYEGQQQVIASQGAGHADEVHLQAADAGVASPGQYADGHGLAAQDMARDSRAEGYGQFLAGAGAGVSAQQPASAVAAGNHNATAPLALSQSREAPGVVGGGRAASDTREYVAAASQSVQLQPGFAGAQPNSDQAANPQSTPHQPGAYQTAAPQTSPSQASGPQAFAGVSGERASVQPSASANPGRSNASGQPVNPAHDPMMLSGVEAPASAAPVAAAANAAPQARQALQASSGASAAAGQAPQGNSSAGLQAAIARIHEACRVPPLSPPEYRVLFAAMAEEIKSVGLTGSATLVNIAQRAQDEGVDVSRDDVRFILEVVSETDPWFEQGASSELFAGRFRNFVVARCRSQGLQLSADELDLIEAWFSSAPQKRVSSARRASGTQATGATQAAAQAGNSASTVAGGQMQERAAVQPRGPGVEARGPGGEPRGGVSPTQAPQQGYAATGGQEPQARQAGALSQQAMSEQSSAGQSAPAGGADFPRILQRRA